MRLILVLYLEAKKNRLTTNFFGELQLSFMNKILAPSQVFHMINESETCKIFSSDNINKIKFTSEVRQKPFV